MAALLFPVACNQDLDIVNELQCEQVHLIPYKASVSTGIATRATLNDSGNYEFQSGDRLYVWGKDNYSEIYGELSTSGSGYEAEFSGTLYYIGEESHAKSLDLNAVIVSSNNQIFGSLDDFKANKYKPVYPNNIAPNDTVAVQSFSHFETTSRYEYQSFIFDHCQKTAFISFDITLEDGTAEGNPITVSISNGGSEVRSGSVTAVKEGNAIKAKFTAGFKGGYEVNGATVQLGTRDAIEFGGTSATTLAANGLYKVAKTYTRYKITASATLPDSYGGGEKSMSTSNIPMGYQPTLQDILYEMGPYAQVMGVYVQGCTRKSGTSVNVTDLGGNPHNYRFTVAGVGDSVFDMTVTNPLYPYDSSLDPTITVSVTINVSKMTPPEP